MPEYKRVAVGIVLGELPWQSYSSVRGRTPRGELHFIDSPKCPSGAKIFIEKAILVANQPSVRATYLGADPELMPSCVASRHSGLSEVARAL